MEIIRKKICLESGRNRTDCMLPYYPFNEDYVDANPIAVDDDHHNWGGFLADFDHTFTIDGEVWPEEGHVRAAEMMRRYHAILDILRNGVFLTERIGWVCDDSTRDDEESVYLPIREIPDFEEDTELKSEANAILEGRECLHLADMAIAIRMFEPYSQDDFTVDTYGFYHYNGDESLLGDKINVIEDFETYKKLGGLDFVLEVDKILCGGAVDNVRPPYLEIPILFTQDTSDLGVMTDYDDGNDWSYEDKGGTIDVIPLCYEHGEEPKKYNLSSSVVNGEFRVESKLQTLKVKGVGHADDGLLPGVLVKDGEFYKISDGDVGGNRFIAEDAVSYPTTNERYLTVSFKGEIGEDDDGKSTMALVRYKKELEIPYESGVPFNLQEIDETTYIGDYISSKKEGEDSITFVYYIGATFKLGGDGKVVYEDGKYISEGGIKYEETYPLEKGKKGVFTIDGVDVELTYDEIVYDAQAEYVYSDDLMLNRSAIIGTITEMPIGDVWRSGITFGISGNTINAPVYKEEYLIGNDFAFNAEISVDIDRGSSAAFEKHFKLSECNSLSDLEDYNNGLYFES